MTNDEQRKLNDSSPTIADKFRQRLAQAMQPRDDDPIPEPPPFVPLNATTPIPEPQLGSSKEPTPPTFPDPSRYLITYGLIHTGQVESRALIIYHTALAHLERRQWDEARAALLRAVDAQSSFVDPHLWLARLARTTEERYKHYSMVIALTGNHLEAARELMVLNGQLSREEADRSERGEVAWAKADSPIQAQGQALRCPQCGGDLSQHKAQDGRIACCFCGYVLVLDEVWQSSGARSLQMAMLKRRGQERVWAVGERLLQCNACGAERVLPADQLSSRCPFCGSKQVVQADVLRTFEQPDGVIPFRLSEDAARDALHKALNSPMERVKGWFINNKVKDMRLQAVFLPFWLFDAHLIVRKTIQDERDDTEADLFAFAFGTRSRTEERYEIAQDEAVFGSETPPAQQVERLADFDWRAVLPYQAERLADAEAMLYTVDYEVASLVARSRISRAVRDKHEYESHGDDYSVWVAVIVQHMDFRLVMCPFWIAHLLEEDGDRRTAIIQGQNGRVSLGQAQKSR
ncbi:MAG: hypothetical protein NZ750_13175 [Anaerolineae bacterium]|nr:hypothetical protein [Anaerolineae bacterium]MDW8172751.1 hypothetical protein [Anaerolineae bacterium]